MRDHKPSHECTGEEARNFAESLVRLAEHKRNHHGLDQYSVPEICVALLHDPVIMELVGLGLCKEGYLNHPLEFQAEVVEYTSRATKDIDNPPSSAAGRLLHATIRAAEEAQEVTKEDRPIPDIGMIILRSLAQHPFTHNGLEKAYKEIKDWDASKHSNDVLAEAEAIISGKPYTPPNKSNMPTPVAEGEPPLKPARGRKAEYPLPEHAEAESTMFGMTKRRMDMRATLAKDVGALDLTKRLLLVGIAMADSIKKANPSNKSLAEIGEWLFRQLSDGSEVMHRTWVAAENTYLSFGLGDAEPEPQKE
jgi:hypothetical protein